MDYFFPFLHTQFPISLNLKSNSCESKVRAEGALFSAIMSTGRICPCQKKDNSKKIARESVWHNPGEWGKKCCLSLSKISYKYILYSTFFGN